MLVEKGWCRGKASKQEIFTEMQSFSCFLCVFSFTSDPRKRCADLWVLRPLGVAHCNNWVHFVRSMPHLDLTDVHSWFAVPLVDNVPANSSIPRVLVPNWYRHLKIESLHFPLPPAARSMESWPLPFVTFRLDILRPAKAALRRVWGTFYPWTRLSPPPVVVVVPRVAAAAA